MRWSWTPSETGRRRCSSSFPIPMTPSISSWQSCIPSSSTFSATKQMTFTTARLPVHVRCLLDEFANIGQIPKFDKLIATIRSREISASIILQSQSQLKTIYKDAADTITGNCDCTTFSRRKRKIDAQGNQRGAGQGDNRPLQHLRNPFQQQLLWLELSEDRQGTDVSG